MLIVKKGEALRRLTKGLIPFVVVIGVLDVLAALEPDLSVAMLFTLLMALLLFVGGARMGHFIALGAMCLPVFVARIEKWRYALSRVTAFLHPGNAPEAVSYQLNQSLIAVGSGGWFGRGFGEGMQQACFVPFPYSDFVASNVGEEWGFVGLAGITVAFALYGLLGFRIARQARTPFLQLVAVGLTFTTVLTAFLHVGVVIGLLPDDRAHAAVRVVRPLEPRADALVHRHPREHRQHSRARDRERGDRPAGRRRVVVHHRPRPWRESSSRAAERADISTRASRSRARSCARALRSSRSSSARKRGIERDVLPKTEFPYALLDVHPLYRRAVWKNAKTFVGGVGAWRELGRLARAEHPELVVGTGGYAAAFAHGVRRRPSHPDRAASRRQPSRPDRALLQPLVARDVSELSRGGARAAGAPRGLARRHRRADRAAAVAAARSKRGPARVGSSRRTDACCSCTAGVRARSRSIARWRSGSTAGLPESVSLIWGTGRGSFDEFKHLESPRVRVRDYLAPIGDAYAAVDLAIARAGAMTTAELFAWGIPAVLVPLPTAAADHQTVNAVTLERAGAAIHLAADTAHRPAPRRHGARASSTPRANSSVSPQARARARAPDAAAEIARRILALARLVLSRSSRFLYCRIHDMPSSIPTTRVRFTLSG